MTRTWFSAAVAKRDPKVGEIAIYDEIGWYGVGAGEFRDALASLGDVDRIDLRIASGGGDPFVAHAIGAMMQRHPAQVVATVDGIAASAATLVTSLADEVQMPENALMLVHDPASLMIGAYTAAELAEEVEWLQKVSATMRGVYQAKTGKSAEEIEPWMTTRGQWFTAAEAKAAGLADTVLPTRRMQAKLNPAAMPEGAPPEALALLTAAADDDPPEGAGDDAGSAADDGSDAAGTADAGADAAAVTETATAAERQRASAIVELCQLAGHDAKAGGFIAAGKTADQVRSELLQIPRGRRGAAANDELNPRHSGAGDIAPSALWDKVRAKRQGGN